jgi:hypothetical protein
MTASANFTVNSLATPPEVAVSAGSTVTLALTSISGVRTVVWTIEGNSSHTLVNPVITPAGSPSGATATFVMPAGTGQGYLLQCVVNGGNDDEGTYQSQLTKRAIIGVVDASGTVPFCAGETTERSATYGYTERLNAIAGVAGSSGIADHSVTFIKEQQIGVGLVGNDTGTADQKLITLGSGLAFVAGALAVTSVAISSLAAIATVTFLGNITGGSAAPVALTAAQVTANLSTFVASGASHAKGLVPDPGVTPGTAKFLREDATWATPAGTFTNPVNVTDDGKIGYANAGAIAWASAIKTDGTYLAFGGVNPATLTIGTNRYAHATHIAAGLGSDGTTNYDLVQWGVGTNNKLLLGSSAVAVTELQGKQLKVTASVQAGGALTPTIALTGAAHTNLTLSTEVIDVLVDLAQTKQWATGALTTQRGLRVTAPTLAFVGASVVATAATVAISGAPAAGTNATLTQSVALWLEAGGIAFGSSAALSGLTRIAQNVTYLAGRSSTSTDINLARWGVTATDSLVLGDDGAASVWAYAATTVGLRIAGATKFTFSATQLDCNQTSIVNLAALNGVRIASPTIGTALPDVNGTTLSVAGGGCYEQVVAFTANRSVALAVAGATANRVITIRRQVTDGFTLTITDEVGNPLFTFPAGTKWICDFLFNSGTSKFVAGPHMPIS